MKTESIKGELRLNGAAATQNCLENTEKTRFQAFLWEYRTSVERLAVEWFLREYFETIGRFGFFT